MTGSAKQSMQLHAAAWIASSLGSLAQTLAFVAGNDEGPNNC
jgi:hypothetical protein